MNKKGVPRVSTCTSSSSIITHVSEKIHLHRTIDPTYNPNKLTQNGSEKNQLISSFMKAKSILIR